MKAQICFKQDAFRMHYTNLLGSV